MLACVFGVTTLQNSWRQMADSGNFAHLSHKQQFVLRLSDSDHN